MSSLIDSLMKEPLWGEINKVGMFSVPTGTVKDIGINGITTVENSIKIP